MDQFQRDVIDRLARIEERLAALDASKTKRWSVLMAWASPGVLGLILSLVDITPKG